MMPRAVNKVTQREFTVTASGETRTVKLTEIQQEVLRYSAQRGGWKGGWVWGSQSGTERVFAALTKKGLAFPTGDTRFTPCYYDLSVEGKEVAALLVAEDKARLEAVSIVNG